MTEIKTLLGEEPPKLPLLTRLLRVDLLLCRRLRNAYDRGDRALLSTPRFFLSMEEMTLRYQQEIPEFAVLLTRTLVPDSQGNQVPLLEMLARFHGLTYSPMETVDGGWQYVDYYLTYLRPLLQRFVKVELDERVAQGLITATQASPEIDMPVSPLNVEEILDASD